MGAVGSGPYSAIIPVATVNTASKAASPAIRTCYKVGGPQCDETFTLAAVLKNTISLPSFVVQTGTTSALTYTPTTAAHIGTWTLTIT